MVTRKSPLNADVLIFLVTRLEENSQLTLKELVQEVETKFNIETSESALNHALEKMGISWKNVLPIPVDWNAPSVIRARTTFIGSYLRFLEEDKLFYIDESGFNMHIFRSKGRASKGKPATITLVPKGKRVSLIAALSNSGISHYELLNLIGEKKGTNANDFRLFILNLVKKIPFGSVLILDNAKIHHATQVQDLWDMIKKAYEIEVIYLPPYSPFLNPIELAFNDIKIGVKSSQFYTKEELIQIIHNQISQITPQKAKNFFSHTKKFWNQSLLGFPFKGTPLDPEIPNQSNTTLLLPPPQNPSQ